MLNKIFALLTATLLAATWTMAQSTFASIVGVVKDPGEGTVGGAQITLTNLDDHVQRNANADGNGGFEFVNLKPGHYEFLIHADGFSDYKVPSLQLDARQNLRIDAVLKLATSTQTIEVSGERGPAINTENGTTGDSKDFQQITGASRESGAIFGGRLFEREHSTKRQPRQHESVLGAHQ
jgi:uncharacterized surface anchored protein